jgi:IS1 family transposase
MMQAAKQSIVTCSECEVECRSFGKHRNGLRRFRCPQCKKTYTEAHTRPVDGMNISEDRILLAHKLPGEAHDDSIGDAYCFVAIERHTKLVLNFALGRRTQAATDAFIEGLRHATAPQRFQITTDGFQPYLSAIQTTLSDRCDFAQLVKVYAESQENERRYSPAEVTHAEKVPVMGNPDPTKISTSHVERQNLTIRMQMRRLTRLTNAFSKKWENLWAAYCLHFAYYNFCRIHKTLRVTPAMETGITTRVWELANLLA